MNHFSLVVGFLLVASTCAGSVSQPRDGCAGKACGARPVALLQHAHGGATSVKTLTENDDTAATEALAGLEARYAKAVDLKDCEAAQFDMLGAFASETATAQIAIINQLPSVAQKLSALQALRESWENLEQIGESFSHAGSTMHLHVDGNLSERVGNLTATVEVALEQVQLSNQLSTHLADKLDALSGSSWIAAGVCPGLRRIADHIAAFTRNTSVPLTDLAMESCQAGGLESGVAALVAVGKGDFSAEHLTLAGKELDQVETCLDLEESSFAQFGSFMVDECTQLRENCVMATLLMNSSMNQMIDRCIADFGNMATMCVP